MDAEAGKELVRDSIQIIWMERNLAALPNYWTEDCINHAMSPGADNRGLGPLHTYHEQFLVALASVSSIQIDIVQQVAEADRVVTQLTTRMRHTGTFMGHAPTGKTVALDTIRIDRLEAGKIAEHWSVADIAGLMQQMG